MSDLLPCPFCGGEAVGIEHEPHTHVFATFMPDHFGSYSVECTLCSVGLLEDTETKAVAKWNNRAAVSGERVREACAKVALSEALKIGGSEWVEMKEGRSRLAELSYAERRGQNCMSQQIYEAIMALPLTAQPTGEKK